MLGRSMAAAAATVMPMTAATAVFVPFVPAVTVPAATVALPVIVLIVLAAAVVPIAMIAAAPLVAPAVASVDVSAVAIVPPAVVLFVAGTFLVLGRFGRAGSRARVLFGLPFGPRRFGDGRSRPMAGLFAALARASVFHVRGAA